MKILPKYSTLPVWLFQLLVFETDVLRNRHPNKICKISHKERKQKCTGPQRSLQCSTGIYISDSVSVCSSPGSKPNTQKNFLPNPVTLQYNFLSASYSFQSWLFSRSSSAKSAGALLCTQPASRVRAQAAELGLQVVSCMASLPSSFTSRRWERKPTSLQHLHIGRDWEGHKFCPPDPLAEDLDNRGEVALFWLSALVSRITARWSWSFPAHAPISRVLRPCLIDRGNFTPASWSS